MLATAAIVILLAFAYRPVWIAALIELGYTSFDAWLFIPGYLVRLPAVGLAGWLLWRRRERLRGLPSASSQAPAFVLGVLGTTSLALAYRSQNTDLLLPSLALMLLAFGASSRGLAGIRALLAPALVLLLGLRIPAALESEVLWNLQLFTARDAARLANLFGQEISSAGVMLWRDRVSFQVIEACSGFQTARTLLLVAIVAWELLGGRARLLALVALAPLLGYLVNVARAAIIVSSDRVASTAALVEDHTLQGLALFAAGTGLLAAAGWALAGTAPTRAAPGAIGPAPPGGAAARASERREPDRRGGGLLRIALVMSASLFLVSVATPALPAPQPEAPSLSLPRTRAGWTSELPIVHGPDRFFYGEMPWDVAFHRHYERSGGAPEAVSVLLVPDAPAHPRTDAFFTSRLAMPGASWAIVEERPVRLWMLDAPARESVLVDARLPQDAVLVYTWRLRDRGPWGEAWHSILSVLSDVPSQQRPRVAIRMATPLRGAGPLAEARARKTLDRFVIAFRDELAAL